MNKACYLHFCPKSSKHFKTIIPKMISIWEYLIHLHCISLHLWKCAQVWGHPFSPCPFLCPNLLNCNFKNKLWQSTPSPKITKWICCYLFALVVEIFLVSLHSSTIFSSIIILHSMNMGGKLLILVRCNVNGIEPSFQ